MQYSECKSCWLITHGFKPKYSIKTEQCGLFKLGGKVAKRCPCFQCLTKIFCRKPCQERLTYWDRCFVVKNKRRISSLEIIK